MGEAKETSKRQSSGKLTARQRLRESCIFYLDENLSGCTVVQNALASLNIRYEQHLDHFPRDRFPQAVEDHVWLALVGDRKWIALSKDKGKTHTQLERNQILQYGVRYLKFSSGELNKEEMAAILLATMDTKIMRFIHKTPAPFMATITLGGVTLRFPKPG